MSKSLNLKPERVFQYFQDLCAIPHGSGNTEGVSGYCMEFARAHGLEAWQDEAFNVVIVKEASKGCENAPTVILQGHLDMVCEKEADSPIDFEKDGLELVAKGDMLSANKTTLGGDNGIAVAMALGILDDDSLTHPRLECVFTTDEEIGLLGAEALNMDRLQGKRLINIDSEEEGIFTVSCAGGMRSDCVLPVEYEKVRGLCCEIAVEGLLGGHSGIEIHKEHANSNILMGRLLCALSEEFSFGIGSLSGGLMDNAIPRKTEAQIYIREEEAGALEAVLGAWDQIFKNEFSASDPGVTVSFTIHGPKEGKALTCKSASLLLYLLHMVPNGVMKNSMEIPGLVQTSLNLGILKLQEQEAHVIFSVRSSVESEKEALGSRLKHAVEFLGGTYEESGSYPGWEYKKDSVLRDTMIRVYEKMYQEKPKVEAIHAGLECGIFSGKIDGLDCISIGPNLYDVHSPKERLSISSVGRVYEFILEVLKELSKA